MRSGKGSVWPWLLCAPAGLWLAVFVFLPLALVVGASFLSRGDYGQVQFPFTYESYRQLAGWTELGFDPLYPQVLLRTVLLSAGITLLCLAAALPLAFFIAGTRPRFRTIALALVIVPFWTNLLIRTYAWQILLGAGGPLAWVASMLGWTSAASGLPPGWLAVGIGMFCDFLPFMVLPIYASVEKVDWTLAEAAADLGASPWRALRHAVLPQIVPGMMAGSVMVFLPATGQFVIPDLLGGGRVMLLGNLVQQQFGVSRDWPFGAAAAVVLIVCLLLALWMRRRRAPAIEGYGL